jgi:hypothetical protein
MSRQSPSRNQSIPNAIHASTVFFNDLSDDRNHPTPPSGSRIQIDAGPFVCWPLVIDGCENCVIAISQSDSSHSPGKSVTSLPSRSNRIINFQKDDEQRIEPKPPKFMFAINSLISTTYIKRNLRDSNPRRILTLGGLVNRCLKPLGQDSKLSR